MVPPGVPKKKNQTTPKQKLLLCSVFGIGFCKIMCKFHLVRSKTENIVHLAVSSTFGLFLNYLAKKSVNGFVSAENRMSY